MREQHGAVDCQSAHSTRLLMSSMVFRGVLDERVVIVHEYATGKKHLSRNSPLSPPALGQMSDFGSFHPSLLVLCVCAHGRLVCTVISTVCWILPLRFDELGVKHYTSQDRENHFRSACDSTKCSHVCVVACWLHSILVTTPTEYASRLLRNHVACVMPLCVAK